MADNRHSFLLYCDQRGIFDKLSDEQAGKLIKHIFAYVNDENPNGDFVTELAFESIKTALKRDLVRWENQQAQRTEAGKRSAEIRKRNATTVNDRSTKINDRSISSTVNVSVSDSVSVSGTDNDIFIGAEKNVDENPEIPKEEEELKLEQKKKPSNLNRRKDADSLPEGTSTEDAERVGRMLDWMKGNCSSVMRMKKPLTRESALRLLKDYDSKFIKHLLLRMENWNDLKRNKDTNLTFRDWASREKGGYLDWLANNGRRVEQELGYKVLADGSREYPDGRIVFVMKKA